MLECRMAFRRHLRDRGVFVQSVVSRTRMFQHRGSVLEDVSYLRPAAEFQ